MFSSIFILYKYILYIFKLNKDIHYQIFSKYSTHTFFKENQNIILSAICKTSYMTRCLITGKPQSELKKYVYSIDYTYVMKVL